MELYIKIYHAFMTMTIKRNDLSRILAKHTRSEDGFSNNFTLEKDMNREGVIWKINRQDDDGDEYKTSRGEEWENVIKDEDRTSRGAE